MTTGSDSIRTVLKVRYDRRRLLLLFTVTTPLVVATSFLPTPSSFSEEFLQALVRGLVTGPAVWSLMSLVQKTALAYDIHRGTLLVPRSRRRVHPGDGYLRLEYSAYDARIYEVARDGRRHKVAGAPAFANRRDWEALVDVLTAQQDTRRAADRIEHGRASRAKLAERSDSEAFVQHLRRISGSAGTD
jgi:hypothetical protein